MTTVRYDYGLTYDNLVFCWRDGTVRKLDDGPFWLNHCQLPVPAKATLGCWLLPVKLYEKGTLVKSKRSAFLVERVANVT